MSELFDIAADSEGLMSCEAGHSNMPPAWATLTIDLRLLTDEEKEKLQQAVSLLKAIGVGFDTGIGCGGFDMELDWSLSGAQIKPKLLYCFKQGCPNHKPDKGMTTVYWNTVERASDGWIVSYPYCSANCRAQDNEERLPDYKVLSQEVAPGWRLA